MKDIRNFKVRNLLLLFVLALTLHKVFAAQTFQNNLVKADLYRSSLGGVKLNLYTNAPYTDRVFVNKKNDNEYVVLMPETSNSLTSKPSMGAVSDIVKNVEVKTQQYNNQLKGYTKITITTTKPVEIVPHVLALSPSAYRVSENEYKELLSQVKTKTAPKIGEQKVPLSPAAKTILVKSPQKTALQVKQQPKLKKIASKPIQKLSQATVTKQLTAKNATVQKIKERPVVSVSKQITTPAKKVAEVQPNVNSTKKVAQVPLEPPTTTVNNVAQTITPSAPQTQNIPTALPVQQKNDFVSKLKNSHKYIMVKNSIKTNFYLVCGFLASVLILLLIIARKINKNHKSEREIFTANLQDQPTQVKDYSEIIKEDMSWQDKYQSFVDASESATTVPVPEEVAESLPEFEALDELFGEDEHIEEETLEKETFGVYMETEQPAIPEPTPPAPVYSSVSRLDSFVSPDEEVSTANVDELFGGEETIEEKSFDELYEEEPEPFVESAEENIIKSEFVIDDGKGFYLVNYEGTTSLVGHIGDKIFVLKKFNEKIDSPIKARLDEHKGNSANYMARVGDFKALVEVTPENMNLLIEL